jgi:hypothetical protein
MLRHLVLGPQRDQLRMAGDIGVADGLTGLA